MAEKFDVEVPITVKGMEGEKVGKQIGEKIAAQLKKTIGAISIGKGPGAAPSAAGLMGVTKGLKGIATKLGVVGAAIAAAVGLLAKASPYLKGILSIFGRAFMIFFRPFGDFLATLLRPLAILMMKMAVAFLRWTRPITGAVGEAVAEVPQIGPTGLALPDIAIGIANWALKLGAALGSVVWEIGKAAFDLGAKIGQWLYDKVIVPAGDFLYSKLFGIWTWTKDFVGWLWEKITSIWTWTWDFSGWIWEKITGIWTWTYDFAGWIWKKITSIFRTGPFGVIGKLFGIGGGQVGIPSVPHEGLYHLHKGEEVVPRTRAGQNRSVIFKPTFQITGNIAQDIDVDTIVRRAGRMTEMDLKQRGII